MGLGAGVAATSGMLVSASRFTHVLDNSIIYRRLRCWAADGDPIRLHSPGIAFYVQSARESAHLLLLAVLGARQGEYRINAISDLGWPASLLDLALAVLAESGSTAPVYFSGYDAGYEEIPFPGLYDTATAGDVSPLLNAFEAVNAEAMPGGAVDAFPLTVTPGAEYSGRPAGARRGVPEHRGPGRAAARPGRAVLDAARRHA